MYIDGKNTINIYSSLFNHTKVQQDGGALYIVCGPCTTDFREAFFLENNVFNHSRALGFGGAIKIQRYFIKVQEIMSGNIFESNGAQGDSADLSTDARKIILTAENFSNFNYPKESQLHYEVESGQSLIFFALLLDEMDNFLVTENYASRLSIILDDTSISDIKILNNAAKVYNGRAKYEMIMIGESNKTYQLQAYYSRTNISQAINVKLLNCQKGESFINKKCVPCKEGFYSLSNDTTPCSVCPRNAFCPGHNLIIPDFGFWRFDENSALIFPCKNKNSSPDQKRFYILSSGNQEKFNFSKPYLFICTEGSYGNLCYNCKANYGFSKQTILLILWSKL